MQLHLIFVRIEVVYGVFCSIERLDLRHSELCRKGEVQHPDGEWRLGLLYQGVHGDWSSTFYRYFHVADFLLDVLEPLLPRPLLVAILSGGLVRIMLPGVASFSFSIRFSTRVEVLLFSGNKVFVTPSGSRSDPIGGSEPKSEARDYLYYILYCIGTLINLFFLRAVPVPMGIQTISVITKIILHIQKNYHRSGVITIYTHIQSPIYLYKYLYMYISNTKHQRLRKQHW